MNRECLLIWTFYNGCLATYVYKAPSQFLPRVSETGDQIVIYAPFVNKVGCEAERMSAKRTLLEDPRS